MSFVNVAALSRYHGHKNIAMSRLFSFEEESAEVNVKCYLHMSDFAPQGWYEKAERTLPLRTAFAK